LTAYTEFKVAIVGAGPSGFYAAEELLNNEVQVDMYEKLPVPFGLVRYGVAPDHQKLKLVAKVFDRTARREKFNFFGNVNVGESLPLQELQAHYHAVILTHGASQGRKPGIPGEDLHGCYTAADLVGWYNGHPDFQDLAFDPSCRSVAIIGHGNVAIDIVRILAKTPAELANSDITSAALHQLSASRIETIHLIGRRGPAQTRFTNQELRELGELADAEVWVADDGLTLNAASREELQDKKNLVASKNYEIFTGFSPSGTTRRKIVFHFLKFPVAVHGQDRVEELQVGLNELDGAAFQQTARATGVENRIPCDAVVFSIGYRGNGLLQSGFDAAQSVYVNTEGRLPSGDGLYAAGWIKRGATGVIGTNKPCAQETVASLLADLRTEPQTAKAGSAAILPLLTDIPTSFSDWESIDREEQARGQVTGKPREKIVNIEECLALTAASRR
jgi:ferredoxin--NADP+ reductase